MPIFENHTGLHWVGEVEFLRCATELLPSLVLRHRGTAAGQKEARLWTGGGAAQPTYLPNSHSRLPRQRPRGSKMVAPPRTNASLHWSARLVLTQWKGGMLPRRRSPKRGSLGEGRERWIDGETMEVATAPLVGLEEDLSRCLSGWTTTVKPRFLQQRWSGLVISAGAVSPTA